jgi:hypothetical protein
MAAPYHIIIPVISVFVLGNIAIYQLIIKTAEKRIIRILDELGLQYKGIRRTGFLNVGDFEEDDIIVIGPVHENGRMSGSHYRYLDFIDSKGRMRTVTVRIKWHIFKRTKLDFQPDLKQYAA